MDAIPKGSQEKFFVINRAENKVRFNSLESVSEEDQHGQNIVQLEQKFNNLSPDEIDESKHFLAKFFNTIQYILNTKGGLTHIVHKQLSDKLFDLSSLMGYSPEQNLELLATIIYYAQHNNTHGEYKKWNYFGYTNYTSSFSNLISDLKLLKVYEVFPIIYDMKIGLDFELSENILKRYPVLTQLIRRIGSLSDPDMKYNFACNLLTLANTMVFLSRRREALLPMERFYLTSQLVLSLAEVEQENLYNVYSRKEIADIFEALLSIAKSHEYDREYFHIVKAIPPLNMECFIDEICLLVPELEEIRFKHYKQIEIERISLLVIAAVNLNKRDIEDIGFTNLPYKLQFYWRSCAIFAHGVTAQEMFEKYIPNSDKEVTFKHSLIIRKVLLKKQINLDSLDNIKKAIKVFSNARGAEKITYENIERFMRLGTMPGEVAKKYEIFDLDKKNAGGSFFPSVYFQMFIDNIEFATTI